MSKEVANIKKLSLLFVLLLLPLLSGNVAWSEPSADPLHLELEADRLFFGPNFAMEDSYLVEGEVLDTGSDWMKIYQHLDSPPRVIDPVVNIHPATLVQVRKTDQDHRLTSMENYSWQTLPDSVQLKGQVIHILYLPHNKTVKSIIIYR